MKETLVKKKKYENAAASINTCMPAALAYAGENGFTDRTFQGREKLLCQREEVRNMLGGYALFGSSLHASRFLKDRSSFLSRREKDMVKGWIGAPWFYCLFRVDKVLQDGLILVKPEGIPPRGFPREKEWDSLALYSPSARERYRVDGIELFMALLVPVQQVYYICGVIIPLYGISIKDFRYFADVVDASEGRGKPVSLKGVYRRANRISDIVGAHPLPFLQLNGWNKNSKLRHHLRRSLVKCVSMTALSEEKCSFEEHVWRSAIEGRGKRLFAAAFEDNAAVLYIGGGSSLFDAMVYISFISSRVFLFAMIEESYLDGRRAVADICSFPEEPQVYASPWIVTAAGNILNCRDEFSELQDHFEDTMDMWIEDESKAC
ncbi:MAG: hypothetical protein R6V67_01845 [Spirochaetia bacterium]